MAARSVLRDELIYFWNRKGVGLCAEAQADGVPCTALGRACETCAMAVAALLAAHPEYTVGAPRVRAPETDA